MKLTKIRNKKSGFTLLEIIIVIIIVGVLASLALPRFFRTIEFSRSTEALNTMGTLKRAADRCNLALEATAGTLPATNFPNCVTWDQLGIDDPSLSSPIFNYTIAMNAGNWEVVATRKGTGPAVGDTITLNYDFTNDVITRLGTGAYAGLK